MMKEKRTFNFDIHSERDEENRGVITGTPIVYEQETDLGYFTEHIARGALNKTDLRDVRLLVNHDTDGIPLARSRNNNANSTMQFTVDDDGMHIRARLDIENNPRAAELYSAIQRGDITGMSFMFTVNGQEWEDLESDHPARTITDIGRVFEVSAVTWPAYEGTDIEAADKQAALDSAAATLESARAAAREAAQTEAAEAPEGAEATEDRAAETEAESPEAPAFERCAVPFADMAASELTERAAAIDGIDCPEAAEERAAIAAELEARRAAAQQAQEQRDAVANETLKPIKTFNEKEHTVMTFEELRKTREYADAFLRGIKADDFTELRALLSTNGTNAQQSLTGYVPVPELLENEIKTAWEEHQLLSLVKKTYQKGNVKVAFELSATGASVHVEGTAANNEEVITLGIVEIRAESLKKWITVSDEALEGTTVDTMGYLYKEIAYRIVELAEEKIIGKINAAPTTSTSTAVSVREYVLPAAGLGIDTIVKAIATVSGQARNLHLAMNRGTRAALIALQMGANYAVDVFDGLKDRIVITDKLPNIGDADEGETVIIAGDFGYGLQANFPNGEELSIKVDNLSLAEKDLVKLVGREYVGFGVVAENAFVRIVVPEQD